MQFPQGVPVIQGQHIKCIDREQIFPYYEHISAQTALQTYGTICNNNCCF